jgi:protease-4
MEHGLVDGLASSSQVARDFLGTEELVSYTINKDPFVEFMERFGASFGKGVASFFSTQVMTMR